MSLNQRMLKARKEQDTKAEEQRAARIRMVEELENSKPAAEPVTKSPAQKTTSAKPLETKVEDQGSKEMESTEAHALVIQKATVGLTARDIELLQTIRSHCWPAGFQVSKTEAIRMALLAIENYSPEKLKEIHGRIEKVSPGQPQKKK